MQKDEVFFWSILSFIFGIFSGSFFILPLTSILLVGSALCVAVLVAFPKEGIIFLGLFLLVWYGGAVLAFTEQASFRTLPLFEQPVRGEVRIVSDPEEKDFFRHAILRFEKCESGACPEERVLWQAPLSFTGTAGTKLAFTCALEQPKNFNDQFDYRMFLAKDGIGYTCVKAEAAVLLPEDRSGKLLSGLYAPKHVLERALSQTISEPEAGLAKGLLLGGDDYLPKTLKESFAAVGLSHMIAVSGYNITLIAEMLLGLGLFFGLWRKQAVWTALFGIAFFIVMIGMPASASRAGAMAAVVFVALQTGRLAQPINALLFAGGAMLLFNPLLLRYDLGFQLSFLATLGILWSAPYQEHLAHLGFFLRHIGEVVLMTIAVELFVLPIILFSFHTFSPLIIIGNFLVVLVPFAMASAFGAAILFLVVPGAHLVLSPIAFMILSMITRSVEWLGSIDGAMISVENFGVVHMVLWYSVLVVGIFVLQKSVLAHPYERQV